MEFASNIVSQVEGLAQDLEDLIRAIYLQACLQGKGTKHNTQG